MQKNSYATRAVQGFFQKTAIPRVYGIQGDTTFFSMHPGVPETCQKLASTAASSDVPQHRSSGFGMYVPVSSLKGSGS